MRVNGVPMCAVTIIALTFACRAPAGAELSYDETPRSAAAVPMSATQANPASVDSADGESRTLVRALGVGHPPRHLRGAQARLMARRAAEVRAVRNLAIKLGLRQDRHLRGFRYVSTRYRPDGSVVVVVEGWR